jgi:hypothetical protein
MMPAIPTLVRLFTYSHSDYEQFATRMYAGVYKVQSPSPEMLHMAASRIRRQDRLVLIGLVIAIAILAWTVYEMYSRH